MAYLSYNYEAIIDYITSGAELNTNRLVTSCKILHAVKMPIRTTMHFTPPPIILQAPSIHILMKTLIVQERRAQTSRCPLPRKHDIDHHRNHVIVLNYTFSTCSHHAKFNHCRFLISPVKSTIMKSGEDHKANNL